MHKFEAPAGAVLLPFLFEMFPDIPRTRVKKWLRLQCVNVNDMPITKHDHKLRAGDSVTVEPGKKTAFAERSALKIIYQDQHVLVINKPAGLLTVATEKVKTRTAYYQLNEWFKEADPNRPERVFIVHRLDRETSGLLVFAKNEDAKFKLQKDWGRVEKHYAAVVEGTPKKKTDTLKSFLAQNKTLRVYSTEKDEFTKEAVTEYKVMRGNEAYSLLDVVPKTGRKNQIRVQLADMGHPIAGDDKYGAKTDPAGRLMLHACALSFRHPVTGHKLNFKVEAPPIFSKTVS